MQTYRLIGSFVSVFVVSDVNWNFTELWKSILLCWPCLNFIYFLLLYHLAVGRNSFRCIKFKLIKNIRCEFHKTMYIYVYNKMVDKICVGYSKYFIIRKDTIVLGFKVLKQSFNIILGLESFFTKGSHNFNHLTKINIMEFGRFKLFLIWLKMSNKILKNKYLFKCLKPINMLNIY